jgi:hypothetical protein
MRCTLLFTFVALCCAPVETVNAQEPLGTRSLFSSEALLRALPPDSPSSGRQLDPRSSWAQVRDLRPSTQIFLTARGASPRKCRLLAADDASVTVEDLETSGPPLTVARDDVIKVSRWVGRDGSVAGAAIGAGGGFLLGLLSTVALAEKTCGGGCGGEQFLMVASLVGMPIVGAMLGYKVPGGNRELRTIYLKP